MNRVVYDCCVTMCINDVVIRSELWASENAFEIYRMRKDYMWIA